MSYLDQTKILHKQLFCLKGVLYVSNKLSIYVINSNKTELQIECCGKNTLLYLIHIFIRILKNPFMVEIILKNSSPINYYLFRYIFLNVHISQFTSDSVGFKILQFFSNSCQFLWPCLFGCHQQHVMLTESIADAYRIHWMTGPINISPLEALRFIFQL